MTEPVIGQVESEETAEVGYECHDCGALYPPGTNTAPCVNLGHYVGPIAQCELPEIPRPAHHD